MKTNKHLWPPRSVLLRLRNVSDKSCTENENTGFVFNNFHPKLVPFMKLCRNTGYIRRGYRWKVIGHRKNAICMSDNEGKIQTHIIRNTYCYSTSTMAVRTRLIVTLHVQCLSCLVMMIQKPIPHREADKWADPLSHLIATRKLLSVIIRYIT